MTSPHRFLNPSSLPEPKGFAHAVESGRGRTLHLGGQIGVDADGRVVGPGLVEQFDRALANVATVLREAGAEPEHLVGVQIFVTDVDVYRAHLGELGESWRRHLGRHYPAVALFGVTGLFDPEAVVEVVALAVVPD